MIVPLRWAEEWIRAWNDRDLEALLTPYAEEIRLRSPFARIYAGGMVAGKTELRAYWSEAMRRLPNLKLELLQVYAGHQALSLQYRDEAGRTVIETVVFDDDDKVVMEIACLDKPR